MSLSHVNIAFKEAQGTATDLESSERTLNMGEGKSIAAEEVLLERKFNGFWKHGSMFRPSILSCPQFDLWSTSSSAENIPSQVTSYYGFKACFKDYQPPTWLPLAFQNYVSQFCPVDQSDVFCKSTFQVASHKGFLCIQGYLDLGHGIRSPSLIVCNLLKEHAVKVLPNPDFNVGLIHMRVDDSGSNYKLLIAGSYNSLSHCTTEEYDSKTNSWGHVPENPTLPGSFKEFQNGAFYKNPKYDQEHLFCISTSFDAMDNQGVLMYDFKRKTWSRCEVPHVTVEQGSHAVQPVGPLSIEEFGRIIFLFSEHKCGDHVYIFIHKLNLDVAGNITWEEVIRKERSADGQPGTFLVYPCINDVPSTDAIAGAGSCIFAFSMEKSGKVLCIHELDSRTLTWGPAIRFQTPKQFALRSSNWTDEEKYGSLLLYYEALNASVAWQGPPWAYISQGLWEWAGFDRYPKSCQGQWDTLRKLYKKALDQQKSTGSVNLDSGLNGPCFSLMEKIFALKNKSKDSSSGNSAKALLGPSRKRKLNAELLLDAAYERRPALGAIGRSSSAAGKWASTTVLQPSPPAVVATVTPFVASTSQPPAADAHEPSSSMALPLIPASMSTQARQPSDYGGPSQSIAHLPCSETNVGLASTSVDEFSAFLSAPLPDAPTILCDNLKRAEADQGRPVGNRVQRMFDYQRAMHALRGHGHELTDAQKRELLMKTVKLGLLKAKRRNVDLQLGDISSNFSALIDVLQGPLGSGFTPCAFFKLLMDALETDISELN